MPEKLPTMMDLLMEALDEKAAQSPIPDALALSLATQLRDAFSEVAGAAASQDRTLLALGAERAARWRQSIFGAVKLVARAAGAESKLVLEQAAETLGGVSPLWQFSHAVSLRGDQEGETDPQRVATVNRPGEPATIVIIDDTSSKPSLVATIRGLGSGQQPPIALVTPLDPGKEATLVRPVRSSSGDAWRYSIELEPGEYEIVFGPE
jgi:hypothetical protein